MKNNKKIKFDETPIVFINAIINTETDTEIPTTTYGEEILDIIGQTPTEDIEDIPNMPNHCIAHRKDLGIDIHYAVGFQTI